MLNTKKMVSQHDLVYERPPRNWEDGFPIGNGHLGAMIWQPEDPDRIVFGITKLDVWDYRFREDKLVPFDQFKELLKTDPKRAVQEINAEPKYDVSYPCPKPCGKLSIGIDEDYLPISASLFDQNQRLRLYEAVVECSYELSAKAVRIKGFVDAQTNVLAIKAENTWVNNKLKGTLKQPITLSREIDETLGMPEVGVSGRVLYIQYLFPDGFKYVMAVLVSGASIEPPVVMPDHVRTSVLLPNLEVGPVYTIYLTVVTSKDSSDPMAAALNNLEKAESSDYDAICEKHKQWWASFWEKSGVELQDRFLEALWYFSIYQLASTCRGDTAPGLFGLWNMTKSPAWHGDYHGDYNISMAHWYLFSSNHLELGNPYFKTFFGMLPQVKKRTAELYQIDGAKYPIATDPDSCVEMATTYYRMMQVTSAYYAIPFWWHYLYSRDQQFLQDVVFPVLEETSKFYLALVERTPDGLVIGPSWSPEQGPLPAYNVNNDLGLIKVIWEGYVEACRVLGKNTPYLEKVVKCLEDYPEYPQTNGRFLDSATAPEELLLNHTGLFSMVYPAGDIDADHPLAEVATRTIDTFYERAERRSFVGRRSLTDVQAWTTQALCSARLRRSEQVDYYLRDMGLSEFLKPNGMFSILSNGIFHTIEAKRAAYNFGDEPRALHCLKPASNTRHGFNRQFQFLEGPSAFVCILNEMLLQSHKGILRIFPAVPERIADCAFKDLRGEGAFLVSARCRDGKTERVEIHSIEGEFCIVRLFRYNGKSPIKITGPEGEFESAKISKDTWQFVTVKGGNYSIIVNNKDAPVVLQPSGKTAGVKSFIDCYGNEIYYGRSGKIK